MQWARHNSKRTQLYVGCSAIYDQEHTQWRKQNPGIVTIKMLCDGLDITLIDFFNTEEYKKLEQELK